jgi:CheY-like chemotaxis protein
MNRVTPSPKPPVQSAGANLAALRLLVVEDHVINRRLAALMLERLGCRAQFAADGREAVQAVQARPYDVILMDCQMPVVDGYEATRTIRQLEAAHGTAAGRRAWIIAMTANALEGDREKCLAAGMDAYISKPVRPEALSGALAAAAAATGCDWPLEKPARGE